MSSATPHRHTLPMALRPKNTWKSRVLKTYYHLFEIVKSLIVEPPDPLNFRPPEATDEALQRDVDYAIINAFYWLEQLPGGQDFLPGRLVLEIGPGINFGIPLILACYGARVMVADRFLTPWYEKYHPKFYARLRDRLKEQFPHLNLAPFDKVVAAGHYPAEVLTLFHGPVEKLQELPPKSVDLVVSNAVLEHLYDLPRAFAQLARITKPGGLGLHQVDFRDHGDFSRPLEFLLHSEEKYYGIAKITHLELGNRYRPEEMRQLWQEAGFEVREFRPNIWVSEDYLKEFLGRLRQAKKSPYRDFPADALRPLSGLFVVTRLG